MLGPAVEAEKGNPAQGMARKRKAPCLAEMARAVRNQCLFCQNGQASLVASCEDTDCLLHPIRQGPGLTSSQPTLDRIIAAYCRTCSDDVASCTGDNPLPGHDPCPLAPFRVLIEGDPPSLQVKKKGRTSQLVLPL